MSGCVVRQEVGSTASGLIAPRAWRWLEADPAALRYLLHPPARKTAEEIIAELAPQVSCRPCLLRLSISALRPELLKAGRRRRPSSSRGT